jgi:NADP-dependent 3-hydroxy acid dehydrogenase YdfG
MKTFKDKVAVITGAASGIGRGIADHCAQEGMRVVLSDVEAEALARAEKEMKSAGAKVEAVFTDVSKAGDVEELAKKTLEAFGSVDLLFNNAGVHLVGPIWECSLKDWEWLLGVNLWGVIHGIHTFVPIMLEQGTEGYIVNTASLGGLASAPNVGVYRASKHAVVTLSETLFYELAAMDAKIKVAILCPGLIQTDLLTSRRNKPVELQDKSPRKPDIPDMAKTAFWQAFEAAPKPDEVAAQVFDTLKKDEFYILTHPEQTKTMVSKRLEDILSGRNPT